MGKVLFHINSEEKKNQVIMLCKDMDLEYIACGEAEAEERISQIFARGPVMLRQNTVKNRYPFGMPELMYFSMPREQMEQFLTEYRKRGIPIVSLKAMETPMNREWTLAVLLAALSQEHAAMQKIAGRKMQGRK